MSNLHRLILVALVALACAVAAPAAPAAQVYLPSNCVDQKVKPKRVIVTCADAGFVLTGMTWRQWGQSRAQATGTARVNDCEPSCADGTVRSYPVRATVSGRKRCRNGRRQYTRLRYSFPEESPFPPDAPGSKNPTARFPCARTMDPR